VPARVRPAHDSLWWGSAAQRTRHWGGEIIIVFAFATTTATNSTTSATVRCNRPRHVCARWCVAAHIAASVTNGFDLAPRGAVLDLSDGQAVLGVAACAAAAAAAAAAATATASTVVVVCSSSHAEPLLTPLHTQLSHVHDLAHHPNRVRRREFFQHALHAVGEIQCTAASLPPVAPTAWPPRRHVDTSKQQLLCTLVGAETCSVRHQCDARLRGKPAVSTVAWGNPCRRCSLEGKERRIEHHIDVWQPLTPSQGHDPQRRVVLPLDLSNEVSEACRQLLTTAGTVGVVTNDISTDDSRRWRCALLCV
jgi:hypothetical protein